MSIKKESKQTFSRRDFLRYTGMTAGMAVLAACAAPAAPAAAPAASSGGEAAATAAPATEKVVIEAWSQMTGLAQESTKGILDIYNEKNTMDTQVDFVYIAQTQGSQSDQKLLTAIAGGTPPALHYADRFTVPQFAQQGFFTNITDYADSAGVKGSDYYPFAWAEAGYKGGIYA
ncbi:MAG: extracellular solute-binding protein, partial [Caldilineaceae bacterium]